MVRTLVSFSLCLRDTVWCTASTDEGPPVQMAAMIRLSSSVRGVRTGEPDVFFAVMLHVVPLASERIKPFFASQPRELRHEGFNLKPAWIDFVKAVRGCF